MDRARPSAAEGRRRPVVGVLSVPWTSVPPRKLGSIANIVHEVTTRLADRFEFHVAAGTWERDASRESEKVHYHPLSDRLDRWWGDRREAARLRRAGEDLHPFHQPGYRRHFVRAAARRFVAARCESVLCMVGAQWLPALRDALPQARLVVWFQDATAADLPRTPGFVSKADLVLGCSDFVATRMAHGRPHATVQNAFDPAVYHPRPDVPRRADVVLYAGRITPEKGVHVLVDAFRELAERRPSLELHLAGPVWVSDPRLLRGTDPSHRAELDVLCRGDYAAELRRRAGAAADRLRFLGALGREDLARTYAGAAVFVHPALWEEPFGMTVVEAMASGTPVVVSARGGVPEFVEEGRTGFVVPSGDPRVLASTLERLLADDALRRTTGETAARTAPTRWTWAHTVASLAPHLDPER